MLNCVDRYMMNSNNTIGGFIMNNFSYFSTVRTMFNNDLKEGLQQAKDILGVNKAMIMTDPGVAALPIWKDIQQAMTDIGFAFETYTEVKPNPTDVTMTAAAEALKATDCDVVIGFGGGSAIDTAKAAALLATNPGKLQDYYGMNKVKNQPMPQIMVTTTAGSGAEVTQFISIVDTAEQTKQQIGSPMCVSNIALLCPALLKDSPRSVTADAGFDALAHCMEGFIGRKANPITDAIAIKVFSMIMKSLLKFVNDPNDIDAASDMILAAHMSTMIASNIGTGDGHNIGLAIGGRFNIPHGTTLAVLLPHVLAFNVEVAAPKLAECARVMGIDTAGMTELQAAQACVLGVQQLRDDLKLPDNFKDHGMTITDEDLERIADTAEHKNKVGASAGSAPRKGTREDFKRIAVDAYHGKKISF